MVDWSKQSILITGGTGSFGQAFARMVLTERQPRRLVIFSRDEMKQEEMRRRGLDGSGVRYFIGDVRDRDRLELAMNGIDTVIHAAALKQVPACEYNPAEAIQTNVMGAHNVIGAALRSGVRRVLSLSTDKAVNPVNLYGATKLCAEKLFIQSNAYAGEKGTRFSSCRYGNVLGSRGSVVQLFLEQRTDGRVTVTDSRMTRFWITLEQGIRFVLRCLEGMDGGEVFIPKLPSMRVVDLARAVAPGCRVETIGIRPGEKLHEVLIGEDEARQALEFDDMYVILPTYRWWRSGNWHQGRPVPDGFRYASDNNPCWLTEADIREMLP